METINKSNELKEITQKLQDFGPFDFMDLIAKESQDRDLHIKRVASLRKQVKIIRPFSAFSRAIHNSLNNKLMISFRLEFQESSNEFIQIEAIEVKVDNVVYPWISSNDENIFDQEFKTESVMQSKFPITLKESEKYEWIFQVTKGLSEENYELPFDSSEYRFCALISCKYKSSSITVLFDAEIDLSPLFPKSFSKGYVINGAGKNIFY